MVLNENAFALAKYRLERAKEMISDAKTLCELGSYASSNNRSYYAIFHAVRALFALEGKDFKKHSGIIRHFQMDYVKTGKFDTKYSDILMSASQIRTDSDYNDFYIATKDEAKTQYENAQIFYDKVFEYIEDNSKE